ncbi:rab11 family-interacting protein 3-like isoform X3 [Lytechinus variegatus]|uniref:rab11 family-interacting protein 3-like isoform X3 n=1 Tax=Lytechinus variegatus TaxID=7654 RepID=UPI001BB1B342|nr:rab11 family-interacting protein 3-like isoform X3 [Lytechinus variegatus]
MESELDINSQLKPVFEALDVGRSGFIETKHFIELAREHFGSGSDQKLEQDLLAALDPETTGLIDFTAFCQGIQSIILSKKGGAPPNQELPSSHTLPEDTKQFTVDDDDAKSNGTSESTYNEYDDSAITDMSEEGTSSPSPLINLEMDEGVEALMTMDFIPSTQSNPGMAFSVPVINGSEENFEDFGENDAGIELEVQDASSLSDSAETAITDRQTPTNLLNGIHCNGYIYSPSKRVSSSDVASQLYRSSSSHNIPKGAIEEVYGEYAASDSDVLELNDKVRDLESQISHLEVDKNMIEDTKAQLKNENRQLHKRIVYLEDQLREMERRQTEYLEKEDKRSQEKLAKQHKHLHEEIEALQTKVSVLEKENEDFSEEVPKLKSQIETLKQDRDKLERDLREVDNNWLALSSEYQRKQDEHRIEKEELEEEIHSHATIMDEMAKELEQLRSEGQSEIARHASLMRSPSIQDLPSRFSELQLEVHQLRKENKQLKDSNDEMSAQILNNGIQIGRSLLHRGTSKSESFAAELEKASKDEIMNALKEEEQMNRDLRGYIGQILTKIIENHPNLLEIKPRSQSVSSVSSFSSYS